MEEKDKSDQDKIERNGRESAMERVRRDMKIERRFRFDRRGGRRGEEMRDRKRRANRPVK